MQHLEGSGTPVLYIGRKVLKGQKVKGLSLGLWRKLRRSRVSRDRIQVRLGILTQIARRKWHVWCCFRVPTARRILLQSRGPISCLFSSALGKWLW